MKKKRVKKKYENKEIKIKREKRRMFYIKKRRYAKKEMEKNR